MKQFITVFIVLLVLLIQGCSQKKTPIIVEEAPQKIQKKEPKKRVIILQVENIEKVNQEINIFLNEQYSEDLKERLLQGTHYDLEYVKTASKTYVFVRFKNSFLFCGSGGCSAEMLEYKSESFTKIESFTLVKSSIYLMHDYLTEGFSQVVVPVSFMDEKGWSTYYNIYEPFSENETRSIYPNTREYKELKADLSSRKKSIKLFLENE